MHFFWGGVHCTPHCSPPPPSTFFLRFYNMCTVSHTDYTQVNAHMHSIYEL